MLSGFITFLPRSKCLLISWLQSPSTVILEPRKIKSATVSTVALFSMKWWDQMPWSSFSECWALSQHFSLSSFKFIKRHFSSSSISGIRVVLSVYLRLLVFLLAILIPACASSSPAFLMMYSVLKYIALLYHLIFMTILRCRHDCYFHFTKAQKAWVTYPGHTVNKR